MLAMFENHWRAAQVLMERFDLGARVCEIVQQTFERWDGKGEPDGAQGEEIAIASRRPAAREPSVGRTHRPEPSYVDSCMMSTMAGRRTVVSEVGPGTPEKASERRLEPTGQRAE